MVGPAMPTPRMLRIGGALASAISSCRISSSMNVRPAPPVLLGPREADEARVVELPLPPAEELVGLGPRDVGARPAAAEPSPRGCSSEPGADLVPEGFLLRGQREIHGVLLRASGAARELRLSERGNGTERPFIE